jgi:hypothetical protein
MTGPFISTMALSTMLVILFTRCLYLMAYLSEKLAASLLRIPISTMPFSRAVYRNGFIYNVATGTFFGGLRRSSVPLDHEWRVHLARLKASTAIFGGEIHFTSRAYSRELGRHAIHLFLSLGFLVTFRASSWLSLPLN